MLLVSNLIWKLSIPISIVIPIPFRCNIWQCEWAILVNGLLYVILLTKNIISIVLLLRAIAVYRLNIIILPINDVSKYLKKKHAFLLYTATIPIVESQINSSPPWQNRCHFTDGIFRCIFVNGNLYILIKISLKFVRKHSRANKTPALFR